MGRRSVEQVLDMNWSTPLTAVPCGLLNFGPSAIDLID
jgi:hypothetical protein